MWYPFFSVPPVGMMTVVFPAFSASRVSSQVSSSMKTRVRRLRRCLAGAVPWSSSAESCAVRRRERRAPRPAASAASATPPPAAAFGRRRRFGLLPRDRAGHQPFDLRDRVVDLDLQERLADLGVDFDWLLPLTPLFS